MKFFKKYSIVAQCKALNKRISEWAYFLILNLDKWFQRYSRFSASKKGGFCGQEFKGNFALGMARKNIVFYVFL